MNLTELQLDVLKRVRDGRPLLDNQSRAGGRASAVQSLMRYGLISVEHPGYLCLTTAGINALRNRSASGET